MRTTGPRWIGDAAFDMELEARRHGKPSAAVALILDVSCNRGRMRRVEILPSFPWDDEIAVEDYSCWQEKCET